MNPYDRSIETRPISRRTVFTGVGVATAAVAGLSACTNYGAPEPAGGSDGGGSASSDGAAITAKTSDIPVGGGKLFVDKDANHHAVITQPTEGEFKAFSSICTHAQCDVAEVAATIKCSGCHQSEFSIADGSVVKSPATAPLAPKTIKVDGDTITVL